MIFILVVELEAPLCLQQALHDAAQAGDAVVFHGRDVLRPAQV